MAEKSAVRRYGRCLECGSWDVARILYGLPDPNFPWPKDAVSGGCCIGEATRRCLQCGHEWGRGFSLDENDETP